MLASDGMARSRQTVPLPRNPVLYEAAQLQEIFRARYQHVLTFLGFGELGYENTTQFAAIVETELKTFHRRRCVVNTATLVTQGFERGVADVYEIAHGMGLKTTGLFPRIALETPERYSLSAFVDDTYFVDDHTWGGYLGETTTPSNMLHALTAVTDEVIAIGGGKHTAQEIREMLKQGKPVRYHSLGMNQAVSVRWYGEQNQPVPDPRGEAFRFWNANGRV